MATYCLKWYSIHLDCDDEMTFLSTHWTQSLTRTLKHADFSSRYQRRDLAVLPGAASGDAAGGEAHGPVRLLADTTGRSGYGE